MPDTPQIHTVYRRTEKLAEAAAQEVVTVLSKETAAPLLGVSPSSSDTLSFLARRLLPCLTLCPAGVSQDPAMTDA